MVDIVNSRGTQWLHWRAATLCVFSGYLAGQQLQSLVPCCRNWNHDMKICVTSLHWVSGQQCSMEIPEFHHRHIVILSLNHRQRLVMVDSKYGAEAHFYSGDVSVTKIPPTLSCVWSFSSLAITWTAVVDTKGLVEKKQSQGSYGAECIYLHI